MNKLLVLLLAASPLCSAAQEVQSPKVRPSKAPNHRYELSATGGIAFSSYCELLNTMYIGDFNTVSLYKNIGRLQIGAGIDFYLQDGRPYSVTPHLILNRTLQLNRICLYTGVTAGYLTIFSNELFFYNYKNDAFKGIEAGVQAGIVYDLGKHFALTAETCVRYMGVWNKKLNYDRIYDKYVFNGTYENTYLRDVYFPSKIGFRWRF